MHAPKGWRQPYIARQWFQGSDLGMPGHSLQNEGQIIVPHAYHHQEGLLMPEELLSV